MGLGDSGDERIVVRNSVAKSIVDSSTVLAKNGGALQRYRHASDERFSLEEGASESGEVLAGGKPSPLLPRLLAYQESSDSNTRPLAPYSS